MAPERLRRSEEALNEIIARELPSQVRNGLTEIATLRDQLAAREAEIAELREAVNGFLGSTEAFETALWGDLPDSATGNSTFTLGALRRLRHAAALTKRKEGDHG